MKNSFFNANKYILIHLLSLAVFFISVLLLPLSQAFSSEVAKSGIEKGDTSNSSYSIDQRKCPPVLEAWVRDDYEDQTSWGLEYNSEAKTCHTSVQSYKDLMNQKGTATNFSNPQDLGDYFQKKFSQQISPVYKNYLSNCYKQSPQKALSAQTKFYSVATKLVAANSSIIDEIAHIDFMSPQISFLSEVECSSGWPEINSKCEAYRKSNRECPISSKEKELDKLVTKTMDKLPKIEAMVELRHICIEKVARETTMAQKKMKEYCDRMGATIEVMRNEIPWVRGQAFQKAAVKKGPNALFGNYKTEYNLSYATIAKGISDQFTDNRKALVDLYKSNLEDFRCMKQRQPVDSCDFNKIRTRVNALPDLRSEDLFSSQNPQDREASTYFSAEKCILERHEDRAQTKKIVGDSVKGIALTVATFGLGEAVSGIQILNATNKLSLAKQSLFAANTGLNVAMTGEGLEQAYKSCSAETKSVISIAKNKEAMVANACQSSASGLSQAKEKENSCIIDALLTAPSVLPLAGTFPSLRSLLNKSGTAANVNEVATSTGTVVKDLENTVGSKKNVKDTETSSSEVAPKSSKTERTAVNSPKVDELPDYLGMGSKEAESAVNLGETLRARKINPRKTHIPEFSDQVNKHIDFARKSIGVQKDRDVKKRLSILDQFDAEASKRVKDKNVTYEWWHDFNYRLSILMTPKLGRTVVSGSSQDKFAAALLKKDRWKTHESFRAAAAELKKGKPSAFNEFAVADAYPKHIVIPTIDGIHGIAALNSTFGTDVSIIGMIGKRIRADGREMYPDHFFRHDHVHVKNEKFLDKRQDLSRKIKVKLRQNYLNYRDNVPLSGDRRNAFEFAYFFATHELMGTEDIIRYGGNYDTMLDDEVIKYVRNPDWYASIVPPWASESDAAAKKFLQMSLQELKKFSESYYKDISKK
ncbi:MAG: hypothetical protein ACXVCR_17835 [Bdellovibrio sp.]